MHSPKPELRYTLPTESFAVLNGVKPQSVRKRLCETGAYFGICPA